MNGKLFAGVIHASADFELGRSVIIHPDAIQAGIEAIRKGRHVIADVQMIQSGTGRHDSKSMAEMSIVIFQIRMLWLKQNVKYNKSNYFNAKSGT